MSLIEMLFLIFPSDRLRTHKPNSFEACSFVHLVFYWFFCCSKFDKSMQHVDVVPRAYPMNENELNRPKMNWIEYNFYANSLFRYQDSESEFLSDTYELFRSIASAILSTNEWSRLINYSSFWMCNFWLDANTRSLSTANYARPKYSSSVCSNRFYSFVKSGYVHGWHRVSACSIVGILFAADKFRLGSRCWWDRATGSGHVHADDNDK